MKVKRAGTTVRPVTAGCSYMVPSLNLSLLVHSMLNSFRASVCKGNHVVADEAFDKRLAKGSIKMQCEILGRTCADDVYAFIVDAAQEIQIHQQRV